MKICQQRPFLVGKDLNLKNLINELDSWLQLQPVATQEIAYDEPFVTDDELAEDVWRIIQVYQGEEEFEEHLERVKDIRVYFGKSNYGMCDKIVNAYRRASHEESSIDDFFYELQRLMY